MCVMWKILCFRESHKTSLNMHVVIRVPFFEPDEMFKKKNWGVVSCIYVQCRLECKIMHAMKCFYVLRRRTFAVTMEPPFYLLIRLLI